MKLVFPKTKYSNAVVPKLIGTKCLIVSHYYSKLNNEEYLSYNLDSNTFAKSQSSLRKKVYLQAYMQKYNNN